VVWAAAKTVLAALGAGKPVLSSAAGEHMERAGRLAALGAGEIPCPRRWDGTALAAAVERVATGARYGRAAQALQTEVERSGGVEAAVRLISGLG
jgi:UDP:flavonoid glycosyltransferase YjiC (YdhE family)